VRRELCHTLTASAATITTASYATVTVDVRVGVNIEAVASTAVGICVGLVQKKDEEGNRRSG